VAAKPPADSIPPVEPIPVVAAPAPAVPAILIAAPAAPPPPPGYAVQTTPYTGPYTGQPGQPYETYYASGYYASTAPKGLAIAALVCGIVGLFFAFIEGFGILPCIAAVITGHLARKRNPEARGMALAGLICGYVGIGISLIWIIVFVVFIVAAISIGTTSDGFGNY
jgi:hypothetical protein